MNPETNNPGGPIELKPGESAHVLRQQQAVDSARNLLDQLPDPHEARAQEPIVATPPPAVAMSTDMAAQRTAMNPLETSRPAVVNPLTQPTPKSSKVASAKAAASRTKGRIPSPVRPILTAVATFSLLLFLFKLPVVISQAKFLIQKPAATLPKAGITENVPAEPTMTIPKINVHAPTVYEPSIAEANVQKSLESGIVHYGNTPKPGQGGNSVFFGHSSNDWWEPGNYKFVFILLDKLVPGDKFSIDYQGKRYVYEVTGSKVVEPTDLSVLTQTPTPTVSLITCTPPGTSWKRLVVVAKQVQPDPSQAQVTDAGTNTKSPLTALPGSPSSLGAQITEGISGLWHSLTGIFDTAPETIQNKP